MLSQVLRKLGTENAHRCAPKAENGFGFDFLERYHKDAINVSITAGAFQLGVVCPSSLQP
jgi:hypothetical protein